MKSFSEIFNEVLRENPNMSPQEAVAEADRRVVEEVSRNGKETAAVSAKNPDRRRVQRKKGNVSE